MKKMVSLSLILATLFSGCVTIEDQKAKVIDSEVEGLEYQCAGLFDYTTKDGELSCRHMPLGFKIGEIRLGKIYTIPEDGIILPQDIVGAKRSDINNPNVVKLSVLLQSLDADKNPENGITITKEVRDKLKLPIELNKVTLAELKELVEAQLGKIEFKQPHKSIIHLNNSMKRFNISQTSEIITY